MPIGSLGLTPAAAVSPRCPRGPIAATGETMLTLL
jgi:hypothetical protein